MPQHMIWQETGIMMQPGRLRSMHNHFRFNSGNCPILPKVLRCICNGHLSGAGSETALVDIQQKVNDGAWSDLLTNTIQTEYWFIGEPGNSYAFLVSAQDYAGNEVSAQTNSSIPAVATLCSQPDSWDISASVNDNTFMQSDCHFSQWEFPSSQFLQSRDCRLSQ